MSCDIYIYIYTLRYHVIDIYIYWAVVKTIKSFPFVLVYIDGVRPHLGAYIEGYAFLNCVLPRFEIVDLPIKNGDSMVI